MITYFSIAIVMFGVLTLLSMIFDYYIFDHVLTHTCVLVLLCWVWPATMMIVFVIGGFTLLDKVKGND